MQDKRMIGFFVVALAIFFGWWGINTYLQNKHPEWYVEPKPEQTAQNETSQTPAQPSTQAAATQPGGIQ